MIHAIGMLLIFMLMTPSLADLWIMGNTASQQRLAADHMRLVVQAARSYVNRHQDTENSPFRLIIVHPDNPVMQPDNRQDQTEPDARPCYVPFVFVHPLIKGSENMLLVLLFDSFSRILDRKADQSGRNTPYPICFCRIQLGRLTAGKRLKPNGHRISGECRK